MNRDLGVWTYEDCALVLIDYQNEMFEVIRSETPADLVELNVRLLAKTAKALDMPIVLSTVGVGYGFNGPTLPSILSELDGIERLSHAGATPTTALAVNTELFRDWATPAAGPARDVIYWYFREAPQVTNAVGVAEAEKQAASAALQGAT